MWINMYMQFDDFKLYNCVSEKKLWPSCMELYNNEKLFSSSIFYDLLKLLCIGNIWSWFIIHMSAGIFDILLFSLPGQKWSWWTSDGTDSVGRSRSPHGRHWPHESGSSSKYFPEILDSDIDAFVKLKFVWAIEVLGVCHALEPRLHQHTRIWYKPIFLLKISMFPQLAFNGQWIAKLTWKNTGWKKSFDQIKSII